MLKRSFYICICTFLVFGLLNVTSFVLADDSLIRANEDFGIIEEVSVLNGIPKDKIEVVNTGDENRKILKVKNSLGEGYIVPMIKVGDSLVNSFEYAETTTQPNGVLIPVKHLVDVTINIFALFNKTAIYGGTDALYTSKGVSFYWLSDNNTAYINDIHVLFDTKGDYFKINPLTSMNRKEYVRFEVYKQLPIKGTSYGDSTAAMNDNYGVNPEPNNGEGGNIAYSINYTVNGVTRYDTYSWDVF